MFGKEKEVKFNAGVAQNLDKSAEKRILWWKS